MKLFIKMGTIPAETENRTHLLCFAINIVLFYSSLYNPAAAVLELSNHGQTSANRTKPGPSFQL